MKKIITTIIFSFFLLKSFAQDSYVKLPVSESNCPTVIIEKDIIANESVIEIAQELIAEISFLKDKPNRKEHKFFNLTANGIYFVSLKKKTPFKTQSELNEFFGIEKNNAIFVNGYLIEKSDYKIATQSIIEIELVEPDSSNKLDRKAINVWTLTPEQRNSGCKRQNLN